jgi:hypothetical protein
MSNMDQKIRFRGYLTFADSLKVQKAMAGRRLVSPAVVITAIVIGVTAFLIYKMQVGLVFGGFLIVFMSAFMFGGLRIMRTAAAKTQKRVYEKACSKRTGMLTEDGITIRKNKAVSSLSWGAFEKAAELEGVVAVMKGTETLGFAKYMFDTGVDWDRAKALILSRYAGHGDSRGM